MIYFDIQDFEKCEGAAWLANKLDHPLSIIRLSLDTDDATFNQRFQLVTKTIKNSEDLIIERSLPVRWGAPSQIVNLTHSIRRALSVPGWKYFVNLSGACFPTQKIEKIFEFLLNGEANHRLSLISHWRERRQVNILDATEVSEEVVMRQNRLHVSGQRSFLHLFFDVDHFPVTKVQNRQYVRCYEPPEKDQPMLLTQPSASEANEIRAFFEAHPLFVGRAWYALERDFCDRLICFLDSNRSEAVRHIFHKSIVPDETFLPTIAWNGMCCSTDRLLNANLHFNGGSPIRFFSIDDFKEVQNQKSFFARKLCSDEARNYAQRFISD